MQWIDQPSCSTICTGAAFAATAGVFNNLHCTTHWADYETVKSVNATVAASTGQTPGKLVASRFVDAGLNHAGVRIISAGGVSCGIDAALHVINIFVGEEQAKIAADRMDYAWQKTRGTIFH